MTWSPSPTEPAPAAGAGPRCDNAGIVCTASPLLRFEDVTVEGPGGRRLDAASGEVPDEGVTVLAGPSGAGKSTLLRCCNRLEVPSAGRVLLRGEDVANLDPLRLRRRVGMVFQRPTPFPGSVLENLRIAEPTLSEDAAARALVAVGLDGGFAERLATDLSGGEAQRVCLARTLVTDPEVVLLDEVTSSVDPAARLGLEALARGLAEQEVRVLWVTHDLEQLRRVADHVLVLIAGRVAYAGPVGRLERDATPGVRRFLTAVAVDDEEVGER
jgi:putative ABC transport system ATP-binding protein